MVALLPRSLSAGITGISIASGSLELLLTGFSGHSDLVREAVAGHPV